MDDTICPLELVAGEMIGGLIEECLPRIQELVTVVAAQGDDFHRRGALGMIRWHAESVLAFYEQMAQLPMVLNEDLLDIVELAIPRVPVEGDDETWGPRMQARLDQVRARVAEINAAHAE